ncbi:MAG: 2-C-methyl-D-erythritol 4-phosphate cytidylyltransferase [Pseudomonadota bacterium]
MIATAVIAAGGAGTRFGRDIPKQFLPIHGIPMIVHTLLAFERAKTIGGVVVVLPESHRSRLEADLKKKYSLSKIQAVLAGGADRQASVGNGLEAVQDGVPFVAIHDAARCLITPDLIDRTVNACHGWDGAVAALPVRDTLKRVDGETILATEPRERLWGMQTPQVFRFPLIREAYRNARADGFAATDDAAVAERYGARVRVVEGSTRNIKVTYEDDLKIAERILAGG